MSAVGGAQAGFGESLKLVGSLPATGEWDVNAAPTLRWCDRLSLACPTSALMKGQDHCIMGRGFSDQDVLATPTLA